MTVGIVGLGYVGLPLAVEFAEAGTPVVGVDVDGERMARLTAGASDIALVNELAVLPHRMGIDVWEVVEAAATKPFGFMRFDPGPGMGGHCLPVDPFYLSWRAREFDFVELAGKINQNMPYFCAQRAADALNRAGKAVQGSRILLLGVAYKPGVADTRESPALKLIELLADRGAEIAYHDPLVADLPERGLSSETDLDAAVEAADLVIVVTPHAGVDHRRVAQRAAMTLDLRGVTRGVDSERVVRL